MRRKFFMSFLLLAMGMLTGMPIQAQQKMRNGAWRVEQQVMQQHKNVIGRMNPPRSFSVGEGMDRSRFSSISGIITPQPNKQGFEKYRWHSSSKETAPLTFGERQNVAPSFKLGAKEYKLPAEIYGLMIYSGASSNYYGIYKMDGTSDVTPTAVLKGEVFNANGGGVYANGRYHFINYSAWYSLIMSYDYYQYDTEDWTQKQHVNGSETHLMIVDGDYDSTTDKVYALMYTDDLNYQVFGTLDYESNTRTVIKQLNENFFTMAVSPEGEIFSIRNDGALVKFNKTNGSYTKVGDTGVKPIYMQSAAIDPRTGVMYWAACYTNLHSGINETALYAVDTATGETTLLKQFPNNEEFSGLFIPAPGAEEEAPAIVTTMMATYRTNNLKGAVKFVMPKKTYAGDALTGELGYRIYANGELKAEGKAEAGARVTDSVEVDERGMYEFRACAYNEVGEGPRAKTEKFVGDDAPVAPGSVTLAYGASPNELKLSWSAPTKGVHGGYLNTKNLNYTVVRYPDNVVVAEKLTTRLWTETVEAPQLTTYYYEVIAFNDTIRGESKFSNHKSLGDAYSLPYFEDFEDLSVISSLWTVIDSNNDGSKWENGYWKGTENSDIYYTYHEQNAADDWMISPAIHLEEGHFYNVAFNANCSLFGDEKVSLWMGNDKTAQAMKQNVVPTALITTMDKQRLEATIMVNNGGSYFFGFHAESDANQGMLEVDDLEITENGVFNAPDTVNNFRVIPAARGVARAVISFFAPTTDFNGDAITSLDSIVVLRGAEKIRVITSVAPGDSIGFLDTKSGTGNVTYYVTTYNENGHGISAQCTAWVGTDIPTEPTDVLLEDKGSYVKLSWTAPTTGVHGGYVNPSTLTYNIEDNNFYIKADHRAGTSYTETINQNKQDVKYYRVSAQSSAGGGNYVYSNTIVVGNPYTLPFRESFANIKTEQFWSQQNTGGQIGLSNSLSQDADQGCALFKPEELGDIGMITSGKISLQNTQQPTLEFYYYAVPGQGTQLSVAVTPEGVQEQMKVEKAIAYSELTGNYGWRKVSVPLDAYTSYNYVLLSFIGTAVANNMGDVVFDNIVVREQQTIDVAVSLEMPTYLPVNTESGSSVVVENLGREAATFVLQLYKNDELVDEQGDYTLAPNETNEYSFDISTTEDDPEENVYEVRLVAEGDGDESNNVAKSQLTIAKQTLPCVTDVKVETGTDDLTITWESPKLDSGNIQTSDDFENYNPFITRYIGAWTCVDADGIETLVMQGGNGSSIAYHNAGTAFAYQVFNIDEAGLTGYEAMTPHSGNQMLINMIEGGAADDWLISPRLSGKAQTISFWVKSMADGYLESFELLYSSEDKDVESFVVTPASINVAPTTWMLVTAELPEGANYFAIRVKGQQKFMLMLDDVTYAAYGTGKLELLGYNVYIHGEQINSELITGNSFSWVIEDGDYTVTAVYSNGESLPSEAITVATDIHSLLATDSPVQVFDLTGKHLGTTSNWAEISTQLQPGIYVMKGEKASTKVIIR